MNESREPQSIRGARVPEPPRFTPAAAASLGLELYGLSGEVSELPSERDQNFLLRTEAAGAFVLKISHSAEDPAVLDCQHRVIDHLADALPHFRFPRPRPTREGKLVEAVEGAGGEHLVRLLEYVPGLPLARIAPHSDGLLEQVGRLMGSVDAALASFTHPAAHRSLQWDLQRGREVVAEHIDELKDPGRRALVEHFAALAGEVLPTLIHELRTGVIHGDANDWNLIVADGTGARWTSALVGLIDFGDIVHSWIVAEPAIAAAYAMLDKPDPVAAAAAVLRGYQAEHPLTEPELEALFPLIALRLCTSVVLSAHQRSLRPENEYLSISEAGAWRLLEHLRETPADDVGSRLQDAASRGPPGTVSLPHPGGSSRTSAEARPLKAAAIADLRRRHIGANLSVSYREPLHIVRGWMQHLYDAEGREYLDCVNNVAHVGHCHPRVVDAIARQSAVLNTNTRYLHENLVRYAERLSATLPEPLSVCYFVNSGSEANELALRLARAHTGRDDVIVLDAAYHGNTGSLVDLSPYKLRGPGGHTPPPTTHIVPLPDPYRGSHRADATATAGGYVEQLRSTNARLERQGSPAGAFLIESLPGCGGQIVLPAGYLADAFAAVRAAGAVCIADEVQVGFGRVGTHFWGFETYDAVPDIVTMGKPIGNGHPLGAVVTTPEIAASFANGMEYFNTFGGNPVSCAAGLAVLDVLEEEDLQARALSVGTELAAGIRGLMAAHPLIGDVRGRGLYLGIELVLDRETLEPAPNETRELVERMRGQGILLSTDGPLHNVIKIKPPLQFSSSDAERVVAALHANLGEMVASGRKP